MSETESLLNDERLYAIKNNKKLIENLKRRPRQTLPEVKVGFFFIDKGADEIEYEPSLEHTSKTPDYRIILDGTEFFVEVKTVSLEELKIDKKPSGLKTLCWEFGKHDWNALYDALRRAKKGIVGPYIVFLEINVSEKITLSLRYFEEGRDSAKFCFVKEGGNESLQPKWIKTYKTLSRRDGRFAEISAIYVFSKDINNGDFVVSPSLSPEDKKFIEKILAPNHATKELIY